MMATLESLLSNPEAAPFWEGVQADRFLLQRCARCARFRYYPRAACPHCLWQESTWEPATGEGQVYAATTVQRAPEGFDLPVPYQVALVDLVEGVRVLLTVAPGERVEPGQQVRLGFRTALGGLRLPVVLRRD